MTKDDFYNLHDRYIEHKNISKRKLRRINEINIKIDIKASYGSEVQSGSGNGIEYLISEKLDLEKEINELSIIIQHEEKEILRCINKIDNDLYRQLLIYKYINGYKWADISKNIGYSTDHARGILFRKARDELFKVNTL